jgi:hypothetical protein
MTDTTTTRRGRRARTPLEDARRTLDRALDRVAAAQAELAAALEAQTAAEAAVARLEAERRAMLVEQRTAIVRGAR